MSTELEDILAQWLPVQRWFGAMNHALTSVQVRNREVLHDSAGLRVEHLLLAAELVGAPTQLFQVPLSFRAERRPELAASALNGHQPLDGAGGIAYDALRDPAALAVIADALATRRSAGALQFQTETGVELPTGMAGRALSAEQSNSSVILGERLLLKVFRRVAPGLNLDLELHRALAAGGCPCIAPVRGWLEGTVDGEPTTLAMAQDYAANSADGWQMALTSVRDLFAEADLHAEEVGTDFADEAHRIGAAVAQVHTTLAEELGTEQRDAANSPVEGMLARLASATAMIPALTAFTESAREIFLAAQQTSYPPTVQRVHGDLHLGQLLRTPRHWLLIDFEGEPAKTLAERRRPDSVLRDVAGMLRSFDYAAFHQLHEVEHPGPRTQLEFRARQWAQRNIAAFCSGYAEVTGTDPREHRELLRAYELDKAVYEAVYEAQNRPSWLEIPLRAIRRLTGATPARTEATHRTEQDPS